MREYKLFIDGEWIDGTSTAEVKSPFNDETVGIIHKADEALVEKAIVAGQRAEKSMAALSTHERRMLIRGVIAGLEERFEDMAEAIRDEAGKPIKVARGEVRRAIETFEFAEEHAQSMTEESIMLDAVPTGRGRFGILRRFPIGLVSAISPFNFPLNLVAHKLAPAIATGCPVVLKPASSTPMASFILAEVCEKAGLPKGGLNVIPCNRSAADALTVDERFKLLSFTGSPAVGWPMKNRAGKKKVVLELGGNAGVIVHSDCDLDLAVRRVAMGAYAYAGQVCISVQRILVHEPIYKEFSEKLVSYLENELGVGDPRDESVLCGPLIDAKNASRVVEWVEEAKEKGGDVLTGGERDGNIVKPVLLANTPEGCRLATEEVFGPVATIQPYKDMDHAIEITNDSVFGLQAGVFTDSVKNIWKCYEQMECGGVVQNDVPTFRVDNMPYGGVKDSGFGREGLPYALEDYTELRLLVLTPEGA
jgi:glyceraldehyde-3-phosphate dehydrogenase (NADP+)